MNAVSWKRKVRHVIRSWGFPLVAAVLIATSFKSAVADWNDVPTGSMKPTILIGDRVFINKLAYGLKIPYTTRHVCRWAEPGRGDIVVFYSPKDGTRLIKRVVGIPGDSISMYQKRLFINDVAVPYELLDRQSLVQMPPKLTRQYRIYYETLEGKQHPVMVSSAETFLDSFDAVRIPKGKFFMMGDNRDNSADSRVFGFVDSHSILGHATTIVMSRDGSFLNPRWERFFKKLI